MDTLDFDQLSLRYDTRYVLKDFSATIATGEFIGILGANGAGKSTLLRAILGLIPPAEGNIFLFGEKVQRGHTQIGYLPQSRQLVTNNRLSGRARLFACMTGNRWGLPRLSAAAKRQIAHYITLVEAESYADQPFSQLSGGEKQRLLLVQALLNRPRLLLLDEPLAGLDLKQQRRLIHIIQRIRQEMSVTVLLTAHDINPLLPAVQRIIYLAQGKGAIGTVSAVINSATLSTLYGTPVEVIEHNHHVLVYHPDIEMTDNEPESVAHHE